MAEEGRKEPPNVEDCWDQSYRMNLKATMTKRSKETAEGCRVWTGSKTTRGYGRMFVKWGRRNEMTAHQVAYILHHKLTPGTLPRRDENDNRLVLSHICRNSACVRHIVLEKHSVRMERIHCRKQGLCTKCHEPHCHFVKTKVPSVVHNVYPNDQDKMSEEIERVVFVTYTKSNTSLSE